MPEFARCAGCGSTFRPRWSGHDLCPQCWFFHKMKGKGGDIEGQDRLEYYLKQCDFERRFYAVTDALARRLWPERADPAIDRLFREAAGISLADYARQRQEDRDHAKV